MHIAALSKLFQVQVLPAVSAVLAPHAQAVVLVKPQFEAGPDNVSRGGVVRDPDVHTEVLAAVRAGAEAEGFAWQGHIVSPLKGAAAGNTEFLAHLTWGALDRCDCSFAASDSEGDETVSMPLYTTS